MSLVVVASVIFGVGLFGVMARRDIVGVLIAVEVMMGAALVLLVALGHTGGGVLGETASVAQSQAVGLLVLVAAAAEASVGLALLVALARRWRITRMDEMDEGRG